MTNYQSDMIDKFSDKDVLNEDDLKELLLKCLKKKGASKEIIDWFDYEFHVIFDAGRWKGLENFYNMLR